MRSNEEIYYDMDLEIDGMGIVFYSEGAIEKIQEGENYFYKEYRTPEQVAKHLQKGDMVGFCTGSGGSYKLRFRSGYPNEQIDENFPITIRLAINVKGGKICVKDIFWLMEWCSECPSEQEVNIEDGIYHMTVNTSKPKSNVWGDDQEIYIYLNRLGEMPQLAWKGVPELFRD